MQQALAVITPQEGALNIKSEMSSQKQEDESGIVQTAVQVQTNEALSLDALSIPQHQGFAQKQEELGLAETDESICASQVNTNTHSTSILECAQKIPNQQGIDNLESSELGLQAKVEEVSLCPKQMGEPAISIRKPKSTGFFPEQLSTYQVSLSEEKLQQPNFSTDNLNVRLKNLPEQISKPLGEHSNIEYSTVFDNNISQVTPVTEQKSHGQFDILTCVEKCEGYEQIEESAPPNEKMPIENVQFASKSPSKNSAKEVATCIEKVTGHFDGSDRISDIPETLSGSHILANEESPDNFRDLVVDRISNVVGHGEGHGTSFNIFTTKSNLITVNEKSVSPPAEAHNVDNSEGFLPIQENIKVINGTESVEQKAVLLTTSLPARAVQTDSIQGYTHTLSEAHKSDKTEELTPAHSEAAILSSSKNLAHQFATCVEKTTGHGEGYGLIEKLSTETDIHTASEKCVSPPGEAARIGKHEGFVPIEGKVGYMTLSETPSVRANTQTPDILNRAIQKESHEGYFGMSDNLGEISSTIQPSTASASVTSPTHDIGQILQAGFLPVQEKVAAYIDKQPLEYKDAQILEEEPTSQLIAASQSLTGGIATNQEKVEEQTNVVTGDHFHSVPAITSITDANIIVGQDLLVGSHVKKEQQTEEYCTDDVGKTEQIIPTNMANETAICAGQEEVPK